jgi:hypothetical protein
LGLLEPKAWKNWKWGLMNLREYRVSFFAVVGILTLLVASPPLSRLLVYPRTEFFTEFWILDSNHGTKDYPFNITSVRDYSVFLGIANHLGYCAYYSVQVKFRNQTQPAPNSYNRTSSGLPSLFNITAFVADEGAWEQSLTFSFDYKYNAELSRVEFRSLTLNQVELDLGNVTAAWDPARKQFSGNLFLELWKYNITTSNYQYHERSVGLRFNMTV